MLLYHYVLGACIVETGRGYLDKNILVILKLCTSLHKCQLVKNKTESFGTEIKRNMTIKPVWFALTDLSSMKTLKLVVQ